MLSLLAMLVSRNKILIAGSCALLASVGIARFGYTPMIPYMQQQTGMGNALAGWLAGWNYIGYLLGVIITMFIHDVKTKYLYFRLGMILVFFSMIMMVFSDSVLIWAISRILAGLSSAAGIILASGLVLELLIQHNKNTDLGFHYAGVGFGIVIGSLVIEGSAQFADWQQQWHLLTWVSLLFVIISLIYLPQPAENMGHESIYHDRKKDSLWFGLFLLMYFCAGLTCIINATFIVVMIDENMQEVGRWMWLLSGLCAVISPLLWDRLARRFSGYIALQIAFMLQLLSVSLPLLQFQLSLAFVIAISFGLSFMGIVSLSMSIIGRHFPKQSSEMMAVTTLGFAIAQILGPILAGELSEYYDHFAPVSFMAVIAISIGYFSLFIMSLADTRQSKDL